MRSLSCNGWISIDHTFKVAANVGYFRSDHKWVTQYNSLFIIVNEVGQVLTWQFTKSEATSEVKHLMEALLHRFTLQNVTVNYVVLDDCCKWHAFLQDVFGGHVIVKLDLFHAVQCITRTFSRRDPYYSAIISELRMVFRMSGDIGKTRSMPTPQPHIIYQNLHLFLGRWQQVAKFRNTTLKEIENLKKHIIKGCLTNVPTGFGTNRNEALHKHINPYFRKSRLGVQAAYALLCLLFYMHNKRKSDVLEISVSNLRFLPIYHMIIIIIHIEIFGILDKSQQ